MAKNIKLILIDDHPLIMAGIKAIIESNPKFEVIGEAKNGQIAIDLIADLNPDGVLLDIDMPLVNGIEVANYIISKNLHTKIVFLTSHQDMKTFSQAIQTSYSGFVFKENAIEEIETCINEIFINNKEYKSPAFIKFLKENNAQLNDLKRIKQHFGSLTRSEVKVLKLISLGKTTPEIAEELFNSYKTIENHRYNICQKLSISGSNNLLSFALEHRELIQSI